MSTVFHIPTDVLSQTELALHHDGLERTAVWQLAEPPDHAMSIKRLVIPAQQPIATATGHLVHVAGHELARMQFDAYHAGLRTWIQLHTHPTRNVHMSVTDKEWAIADFPGALSIIVPSFGRLGIRGWPGVDVNERADDGWRRWDASEILARLVIV